MNKTVQLKDRDGNNLYPKTPLTNVIGLATGLDNRHIFFGSGAPSNVKSSYENIQVNDLYINTNNSDRDGIFYRVSSFYTADVPRISWDLYGYYFIKSGTPPTTGQDWSVTFGGASPYPRKGLLWCDTNTGHIYEFTGTPYSFTWRCLTDNYSKDETDALIAALQLEIDEKADRIEESVNIYSNSGTIILDDSTDGPFLELYLYGKSVQDGIPTVLNPREITDINREAVIINNISKELNRTLRGIKVSSGGNYIDNNNQHWTCDTIELYKDGTAKLIQRIGYIQSYNGESITTPYMSTTGELSTGATIIYILNQPIETNISNDSDILNLRTLSLLYPSTRCLVIQNTKLTYVADTKNYFDKKIEQIQNAIISNGGNV